MLAILLCLFALVSRFQKFHFLHETNLKQKSAAGSISIVNWSNQSSKPEVLCISTALFLSSFYWFPATEHHTSFAVSCNSSNHPIRSHIRSVVLSHLSHLPNRTNSPANDVIFPVNSNWLLEQNETVFLESELRLISCSVNLKTQNIWKSLSSVLENPHFHNCKIFFQVWFTEFHQKWWVYSWTTMPVFEDLLKL